jgi:hypothetical protein
MRVASVHLAPFVFGSNTLWLGLHGLLMFFILMFAVFLFRRDLLHQEPGATTVRQLKISAACSGRCCC